jgi:hypothetical protein
MIELELLITMIFFALGGYGIGRTIVQESLFEEIRGWIKRRFYYDTSPDDIFQEPATGEIVRRLGPTEFVTVSEDGYRTDLPRPIALFLGKIADLISCVFCGSAQAALQLGFWTIITPLFPFWLPSIPLAVSVVAAAVGLTYMINDHLNARVDE